MASRHACESLSLASCKARVRRLFSRASHSASAGKRRRRHRAKIPMAMAENLVTRLQLIVLSGTDADVLRLVTVANEVFRPGPHEKNGDAQRPMPATFVRASGPTPAPTEATPTPPTAPGTLLDANGQEYVG